MNQERKTVLVVDDDEDFRAQLQVYLEQLGFHVLSADGEVRAEELLREFRPDLAIVDLMMERMDAGFTLSRRIKQMSPSVPVIMVTGVSAETGIDFDLTPSGAREWIRADAILSKPVRFEQLSREIHRLLEVS
jgi:CheY-like chemotaxis protein